jgi:hypothetical protein
MKPTWAAAALGLAALGLAAVPGRAADPAYVDRLIAPATLPAEEPTPQVGPRPRSPEGPPRTLLVEARGQSAQFGSTPASRTTWASLRGTLDSEALGYFSLDLSTRLDGGDAAPSRPGDSRSAFLLEQRRMPLEGGWKVSNSVGLVQARSPDLLAQQVRYGLPSRQLLGASTQWVQESTGWLLQAAAGRPAQLDLAGQSRYTLLGGDAASAGLRWRGNQGWAYAAQWSDYRAPGQAPLPGGNPAPGTAGVSSNGLLQALRWERPLAFAQLNWLHTRTHGQVAAQGLWLDLAAVDGAHEHRAGLNQLPRGLQWLGDSVVSGTRGGFYRWRWRSRQMLTEMQFDHQRLAPSADDLAAVSASQSQAWGQARWVLDQNSARGMQLRWARLGGADVHSLGVFHEVFTPDWSGRAFAQGGRDGRVGPTTQLGLDGSWRWRDLRLSTAASVLHSPGLRRGQDLSVSAVGEVGPSLSLSAAWRRYASVGDGGAGTTSSGSIEWRLAPNWLLTGALSLGRSGTAAPPVLPGTGAPALETPVAPAPRVRLAWVSLRWDWGAGSPSIALGGRPGEGGGRITGQVFLDANGNGRADAGEERLAQVTVVLDGRYGVRTDAQGQFDFPFVSAGEHRLTVLPDNIPLPWGLGDAAERRITVRQRETAQVTFGAQRQ